MGLDPKKPLKSLSPDTVVAVVGLGYVGLPLAVAFGKKFSTVGFDISEQRVEELRAGHDPSKQISSADLTASTQLSYSADPQVLKTADFVVVAVPTPVDEAKRPDLRPINLASETVGKNLKRGAIVIYESTVYPGLTEEVCVPLLEKHSALKAGTGFTVGYSPERINPGDSDHTLTRIVKVVAGQDQATLESVAALYGSIITAGVHCATSIKVAEAAKVIENTQRDLNIALMNELAIIFKRLNIDTSEVLAAAATKWNFLPFRPGLVGGHCIGVDPYYLTYKAEELGYHPEVILAGRRINDSMGKFVAENTVKQMLNAGLSPGEHPVLVMGLTFKENCPDLRNSKVVDILNELKTYGVRTCVWDPIADPKEALEEYGVELTEFDRIERVGAVVAAVAHREVVGLDLAKLKEKTVEGSVFIDVKAAFAQNKIQEAGFQLWRL